MRIKDYKTKIKELELALQEKDEHLTDLKRIRRILRHDLRNPLSGIIPLGEMLVSEGFGNQQQKELLKQMVKSSYQALELSNILDLEDLSKKELRRNANELYFSDIVKEISQESKRYLQEKDIGLISYYPNSEKIITADKSIFTTLPLTILGNALGHAPKGTNII